MEYFNESFILNFLPSFLFVILLFLSSLSTSVYLENKGFLKNRVKNHFFLTNCDTIINTNYHDILHFHLKENNDLTAVVAKKSFCIPYGVFKNDKKKLYFTEKPKFKFKINVGLNRLNLNIPGNEARACPGRNYLEGSGRQSGQNGKAKRQKCHFSW